MRYFIDTEFIEDGFTIDLISIGIVCEDGREFYAINSDCNLDRASDWVKTNVICHLPPKDDPIGNCWMTKKEIAFEVLKFIKSPEILVDGANKKLYERLKLVELENKPECW